VGGAGEKGNRVKIMRGPNFNITSAKQGGEKKKQKKKRTAGNSIADDRLVTGGLGACFFCAEKVETTLGTTAPTWWGITTKGKKRKKKEASPLGLAEAGEGRKKKGGGPDCSEARNSVSLVFLVGEEKNVEGPQHCLMKGGKTEKKKGGEYPLRPLDGACPIVPPWVT